MTTPVFLAAIGAALLHASWNALVKGAADKRTSLSAVILGNVPFALVAMQFAPPPDPASYPRIAGSIVLHVGYQLFLIRSYEKADLTQVYPIAHGSAPLIVALVSVTMLGVSLSTLELAAVGVIGIGIVSLALVRRSDGQRTGHATVPALITGAFIAAYSLNDGLGAREAGTSLGFYSWLTTGNAVAMAAYLRVRHPETLGRVVREGRLLFWVGGGASFAAYSMVTWAFTQAPIALVAALRETSIVFALLIGVFVLKERLDLAKVASTMTTLIGAALLRYSRQ